MRKHRVRYERLPRIGDRFDLDSASGSTITVVTHASGRCHLALRSRRDDEPMATVALTRSEAAALAALLIGSHIELTTAGPAGS